MQKESESLGLEKPKRKKERITIESPTQKSNKIPIIILIIAILLVLIILIVLLFYYLQVKERYIGVDENIESALIKNEEKAFIELSDNLDLNNINQINFIFYDKENTGYPYLAQQINSSYEINAWELKLENFKQIIGVKSEIEYKQSLTPEQNKTPPITNQTTNKTNVTNPPRGGNGGNPPPTCSDTCNSFGKKCGNWTVCGASVNCGTCTTGTCNSSGQCEITACISDVSCTEFTGACGTGKCNQTIKQCYTIYNVSTTICKANVSECDATEFCSESSATCPADINKTDGDLCSSGKCKSGKCVSCLADTDCPIDNCYNGERRDYFCNLTNSCSYNITTKEENITNGNCGNEIDDDCDGKKDMADPNCIEKCGDGTCEPSENCPADSNACTDTMCYEPTCINGCGQTAVSLKGNDESCTPPRFCDGAGKCVQCINNNDCLSSQECIDGTCSDIKECSTNNDCIHLTNICSVGKCNLSNNCEAVFNSSSDTCRQSTGFCDPAETCSGRSGQCPADLFKPEGTSCDDTLWCTTNDLCLSGKCKGSTRDCSDSIKCTVNTCNENTDQCTSTPDSNLCQKWEYCNSTRDCQERACSSPSECETYWGVNCNCNKCNSYCGGYYDPSTGDNCVSKDTLCTLRVLSCADYDQCECSKDPCGRICKWNGISCEDANLANIEVSVATLKYNYNIGEDIQITDPPEFSASSVDPLYPETTLYGNYVPGEVIVKFKDNRNPSEVYSSNYSVIMPEMDFKAMDLMLEYNLYNFNDFFSDLHQQLMFQDISVEQYMENIQSQFPYMNPVSPEEAVGLLPVYTFETQRDVIELVEELNQNPDVEYAQPNYIYTIASQNPNDLYADANQDGVWSTGAWGQSYDDLWGITKTQTNQAWALSEGQNIIVAIVDTGIDYTHEDLKDNMWKNPDEIAGNGVDDDKNGFIDDIYGWDFYNNDNDPKDDHGHGSHCSGTIGAVGNNAKGIIGMAPKVKLMALKGLSGSGSGTSEQLGKGIKYAVDNGARVISNSWGPQGGNGGSDKVTEEAAFYAYSKGAVVVFAAGNDNKDVKDYSPANKNYTIAVAASSENDEKCSFSNYGDLIDVAAPGCVSNILSVKADGTSMGTAVGTGYTRAQGTSMATPHVAGLAALVLSINPDFTFEQVRDFIRDYADDLGDPGKDPSFGYGRINGLWSVKAAVGDIKIEITSPAEDSYLKGTVNIMGSASAKTDFDRYEIYYTSQSNPDTPILIKSSTSPVDNGLLGTWDTTTAPEGATTLTVKVFTKDGKSIRKYVGINIDNVNQPPTFKGIPSKKTIEIGSLTELKIEATDPDDPSSPWGKLTYSAQNLPPGASFNTVTHIFTWNPSMDNKGSYKTTFIASDSQYSTSHNITFITLYIEKTKITNDAVDQDNPSVYKNKIVWKENGISLYDIVTKQKTSVPSSANSDLPEVYENNIVWKESSSLYNYDTSTTQKVLLDSTGGFSELEEVDIYKDKVVYKTGFPQEIRYYDLTKKQKGSAVSSLFSENPSVYEDLLLYELTLGSPSGIQGYNLTTKTSKGVILENIFGIMDPSDASSYNELMAYIAVGSFNARSLKMLNLTDQSDININAETNGATDPKIYKSVITWEYQSSDMFNPTSDIYMYDSDVGQKTRITESQKGKNQDIYENKIVYVDRKTGDLSNEIYLAQLYYSPVIDYVVPSMVPVGQVFSIYGDNFGDEKGTSKVIFENGVEAQTQSWSDGKITCTVPNGAPQSGLFQVVTPGGKSNWGKIIIGTRESKIVNNENFAVTGNLKMILQRKSGNSWVDEKVVVNKQVTVPANNYIKLDTEWNPGTVAASQNGVYRVYAVLDYNSRKYEGFWEIQVGSLTSLSPNFLESLIRFIKALFGF